VDSIKQQLLAFGLPGLFVIAFLDSAGVPLPGGVDLVVMLLSWQSPSLFVLVALIASIGSAAGCWVLYRLARVGGDAMLARFPKEKQAWVTEKVRSNDVLAVSVAMLGPPPFPTKLFIVVAGMVRMDWRRFVAAVFFGRLIRYLGEAYLAVRLGDQAMATLQQHYPTIAIALALSVAVFLLGRRLMRKSAPA
jgi:membrane protein YqaA with SNARE-associated domain